MAPAAPLGFRRWWKGVERAGGDLLLLQELLCCCCRLREWNGVNQLAPPELLPPRGACMRSTAATAPLGLRPPRCPISRCCVQQLLAPWPLLGLLLLLLLRRVPGAPRKHGHEEAVRLVLVGVCTAAAMRQSVKKQLRGQKRARRTANKACAARTPHLCARASRSPQTRVSPAGATRAAPPPAQSPAAAPLAAPPAPPARSPLRRGRRDSCKFACAADASQHDTPVKKSLPAWMEHVE